MPDPLDLGATAPLVPPLYQSAVYTLPDLDALDAVYDGAAGYIYLRDGHPNARALGERLARAEAAEWALVTGSGMAALSALFLTLLHSGGRAVASNRLYGRTNALFAELGRFGVTTTFVDTNDLPSVAAALATPARLVLAETISNPLLRVADVPALAELAHNAGAVLVVDNTFATPALCRPLELGADVVMESLTKMIGGHSDVMLGLVAGRGADRLAELSQALSVWGLSAPPFDCWLAARGLDTLGLRVQAASANAQALAEWLGEQPGVARVLYPGRADHPDHALSARVLTGGHGHMLGFDLAGGREAVNRFLRAAPGVPFSPSLGHTTTTCSHPATTSHRYVSAAEKRRQGISDGLIRLSVGAEPLAGIREELARGLRAAV